MTARKLTCLMLLNAATAFPCQVPERLEPGASLVKAPVLETVAIIDVEPANEEDDGRKLLGVMVVGGIIATLLNGWLLGRWLTRRNQRFQSNRKHADDTP